MDGRAESLRPLFVLWERVRKRARVPAPKGEADIEVREALFTEERQWAARVNPCVDDADAAAYGGDELCAQGVAVPPDPYSLD